MTLPLIWLASKDKISAVARWMTWQKEIFIKRIIQNNSWQRREPKLLKEWIINQYKDNLINVKIAQTREKCSSINKSQLLETENEYNIIISIKPEILLVWHLYW